jgi:hypothetical protein
MESKESQKQAFLSFPSSLEISPTTRDSHISTAPATRPYLSNEGKPQEEFAGGGKVEIQKQDFHFPTAPISLRRKERIISKTTQNQKPFTQNS